MNYGSLKTTFMQTMRRLQVPEVSLHDFGEAIDSAELFIASNLPQDVVRAIIVVETADVQSDNPRRIVKPDNLIKIESARIAETRTANAPDYVPATVASQKEFLEKSDYSDEKLICEFNSYLGVNPEPAAASAGNPGSVELVYRKRPTGFMRQVDVYRDGALLTTLNQDADNARLFSTETLGATLSSLGIDYGKAIGGILIAPMSSSVMMKAKVLQVWDDITGTFSYINVADAHYKVSGLTVSNAYIIESYTGMSSGDAFADDSDSPEINSEFHSTMLDIAIGRFLLPLKPQEAGQFIGFANQKLQLYGVSLTTEYGGNE